MSERSDNDTLVTVLAGGMAIAGGLWVYNHYCSCEKQSIQAPSARVQEEQVVRASGQGSYGNQTLSMARPYTLNIADNEAFGQQFNMQVQQKPRNGYWDSMRPPCRCQLGPRNRRRKAPCPFKHGHTNSTETCKCCICLHRDTCRKTGQLNSEMRRKNKE